MGRYRLGDIIRMTRKSLSITQEQLSEDICSVETLSRIETGKQNPSRDTYDLLMERMGRIRERAYSMLSVSDFQVLEKMKLFEDYIKLFEYEKAEEVLNDIKEKLGNSILDQQFLIRAENIVNYRLQKITTEEYLEGFEKAISLTIPKYGIISLSNWPLNFNEALLLLNISIAYAEKKDYDKAIDIIEEVNCAIKQSYMEEQQRVVMQVTNLSNLSKWYGLVEKHEKAIELAEEGIAICKKYKFGHILPNLLYSVVWNKEQLIDMGVMPPDTKRECLNYLNRAYYIASVMQQSFVQQFIKTHMEEKYYVNLNQ
ncbi:helix-turn-helix transcriptional regulator [Mobilitalea sibirica]|uniref:Helix-turn-helix transcriptional regulator n=1 Tax=Mobilitalea sibirica TaxID=1462919 RepID=A0A8J7KZD8_9FIRM|nr:helix-turn-helix transcriptional regulator [Mobilitalea sibirica]MBH1940008.1 helix-turn-helix transcriptional regulator [Mobilitalea sibirica]